MTTNTNTARKLFQFTPLREGRPCRFACCFLAFCISIHAPPRGATRQAIAVFSASIFQFTPLREGRHGCLAGAVQQGISIHAPPRGATGAPKISTRSVFSFQFTPSARGDRVNSGELAVWIISIHAPPRGATISVSGWDFTGGFQFTPLREGRRSSGSSMVLILRFQFTPLREGRRRKFWAAVVSFVFQFTPLREGRHQTRRILSTMLRISIHAPPRGATQNRRNGLYAANYFNSRPSARGDMTDESVDLIISISIHAPPRGATNLLGRRCFGGFISIHAPPRGATRLSGRGR